MIRRSLCLPREKNLSTSQTCKRYLVNNKNIQVYSTCVFNWKIIDTIAIVCTYLNTDYSYTDSHHCIIILYTEGAKKVHIFTKGKNLLKILILNL